MDEDPNPGPVGGSLARRRLVARPSASVRRHDDDFVLVRSNPGFYRNVHETGRTTFRPWRAGLSSAGRSPSGPRRGATRSTPRTSATTTGPAAPSSRSWGGRSRRRSPRPEASRRPARRRLGRLRLARLAPARRLGRARHEGEGRASVGTAFRVPTFTELYYVDPQTIGNPDLRPEQATNVETG
ncbi:MAG: TonB-dependent receptor [Holophagales bacterium]|nr:TonB-dependent receptor [Holophagales bacterium]